MARWLTGLQAVGVRSQVALAAGASLGDKAYSRACTQPAAAKLLPAAAIAAGAAHQDISQDRDQEQRGCQGIGKEREEPEETVASQLQTGERGESTEACGACRR